LAAPSPSSSAIAGVVASPASGLSYRRVTDRPLLRFPCAAEHGSFAVAHLRGVPAAPPISRGIE
jgi:hypothetical protein